MNVQTAEAGPSRLPRANSVPLTPRKDVKPKINTPRSSRGGLKRRAGTPSSHTRTLHYPPPPFRVNQENIALPPHLAHHNEGTRTEGSSQSLQRPYRLFSFVSESENAGTSTPPEFNPDGTASLDHVRFQSTLRLKQKWDSIYSRFADRRSEESDTSDDDEIYLGRGDDFKVTKDNGRLRKLKKEAHFGMFHIKDEDIEQVKLVLSNAERDSKVKTETDQHDSTDDDDDDQESSGEEDEIGAFDREFFLNQFMRLDRHPPPQQQQQSSEPTPMDADLSAFLKEEERQRAKRKSQHLDSDDDEIIDLRPNNKTSSTIYLLSPGSYSESEDDLDILDAKVKDEYELCRLQKRDNLQNLLDNWKVVDCL
ncbi:unnamed protein product [Sympodiomycopsis kandeliae]